MSAFAEHWSVRLKLEDDLAVVEARDRLMEPLRGQPSPNFISVYAGIVGPTLTEPLASPRIINRLNTMIVASVMLDQSLVPVVVKGLQDKNPAIRYWAGRASANLGIWGKLTPLRKLPSSNVSRPHRA
ncbi:MAG: hypothetical protein HC898_05145 [Phycisphaerales bacterium]|nr:hypothetical protein [Phycisphaerales bacterium]